MSLPRRVLPGCYWFISRRCTQRLYYLRPSAAVNRILAFCIAVSAERTGVKLLAWLGMSNHYHAVVYDPEGRVPEFYEHFHKLAARALNVLWKRWENLWSSEPTCCTQLFTEEDVLDKIAYTLTNPIASGLVERVSQWPGISSWSFFDGHTESIERPEQFFRSKGSKVKSSLPETITLALSQPQFSIDAKETFEQWTTKAKDYVSARASALRAAKPKRKYIGRARILAQKPSDAPRSATSHRKLRPAIACKDNERRIVELLSLKSFRVLYAASRRTMAEHEEQRARAREQKRAMPAPVRYLFPPGSYRLTRMGLPIDVGVKPIPAAG